MKCSIKLLITAENVNKTDKVYVVTNILEGWEFEDETPNDNYNDMPQTSTPQVNFTYNRNNLFR